MDFKHKFEHAFKPRLIQCPKCLGMGLRELLGKAGKKLRSACRGDTVPWPRFPLRYLSPFLQPPHGTGGADAASRSQLVLAQAADWQMCGCTPQEPHVSSPPDLGLVVLVCEQGHKILLPQCIVLKKQWVKPGMQWGTMLKRAIKQLWQLPVVKVGEMLCCHYLEAHGELRWFLSGFWEVLQAGFIRSSCSFMKYRCWCLEHLSPPVTDTQVPYILN